MKNNQATLGEYQFLTFFCPCPGFLLVSSVWTRGMSENLALYSNKWQFLIIFKIQKVYESHPTTDHTRAEKISQDRCKEIESPCDSIETLRFSGSNERNVSLVAICLICAVILVMQRLRSDSLPRHEMRQVYQSMTRGRLYRFFYAVVITKSSIDVYCTWSIRC